MGSISWLRLIGAGLIGAALIWGGVLVKGKFDRAAQADAVERQAKADVAAAAVKLDTANKQIKALNDKAHQDDTDRQAADARVHEREEGYVSIIAMLKRRSAAASSHDAVCTYGPDALSVLNDAWAGAANGMRNPAGTADRSTPASASAGGPQHQP